VERDAIFIKKRGLIEARINELEGVAEDPEGNRYVRILHGKEAMRWVPEEDFLQMVEQPKEIAAPMKKNGFNVDYGLREDDPLADMIHSFEFTDDEVFQYQVSKVTGMVTKLLVGYRRNTDVMAPDGVRSSKNKRFRGKKY
jgi:hypothetical protein